MALSYKNDSEADERLNPANSLDAREAAALDQIEAGLRDDGFSGLDDQEKMAGGSVESGASNRVNYQPSKKITAKGKVSGRKKGLIGLLSGITGGVGILLAAMFMPATLLPSLTNNLDIGNNSSSTTFERRALKVFYNKTDASGMCSARSIKCKMGKMSNNALRKLSTKGIVPLDSSGNPMRTPRTGYPSQNPTSYQVEGRSQPVPARQMRSFLANNSNRHLARKVFGVGGAFNLRVQASAGKYLNKRFFSKAGIVRNGGLASDQNRSNSPEERRRNLKKQTASKNNVSNAVSEQNLRSKTSRLLGPAKKGGAAYTAAVAGCVVTKAPRFIAAAVAGVQLMQILPLISDVVLSPGAKNQAAGGLDDIEFTAEDAAASGDLLTERHPNENGELKSALDSKYLLAALGIVTTKLPVSKFAPGYSVMSMPSIQAGMKAEQTAEQACNGIMNPAAMYTAMAANAATTVALSTTIIGGIIKVAASWAISELAIAATKEIITHIGADIITELAENEDIPNAVGEEFGDVLGMSAMSFFSSMSMSQHIPTLTTSQISEFTALKQENEQFHKEMDIASLSPFDISSRHTFLGSIAHNMGISMIASGTYSRDIPSAMANILRIPAMALSYGSTANAATNISVSYCDYADEFGLVAEDESNTPAINAAGLPCTGITQAQDAMTTTEAINLLESEGWLNTSIEVDEGADIADLVTAGVIVEDTPMSDFINECGDSTTGDYMFNSAGCTVGESSSSSVLSQINITCVELDDGTNACASDSPDFGEEANSDLPNLKNSRSLTAISVFLIDYQITQAMSGYDEDDGSEAPSESQDETPGEVIETPSREGWSHPLPDSCITLDYLATSSLRPGGTHKGIDFTYRCKGEDTANRTVYAAHDGAVERVWNMGSCGWAITISATGVSGIWQAYQHMSRPSVNSGDTVSRGQAIGQLNPTNYCGSAPHLHFSIETRPNQVSAWNGANHSKNPKDYIPL